MTPLAAYVLLFVAVGTGFIFVHLVAGKLIRPSKPGAEKGTIYECGEPTIGSAWVQFDLRFYVVALLFVVFDVEVAFFFPWAEVFGKANAVANAPDPETAPEHNDLGEKILDLSYPSNSAVGQRNEVRWKKLARLTEAELAAYRTFGGPQVNVLRSLSPEQFDGLRRLTAPQRALMKKTLADFSPLLAAQAQARAGPIRALVESAPREQRENLRGLARAAEAADAEATESTSLADLAAGRAPVLRFLRPPRAPGRPSPLLVTARQVNPGALAPLERLAAEQVGRLGKQAAAARAALAAAGPDQAALWNALTPLYLRRLDEMTDEQAAALPDLTAEGVVTLAEPVARRAREQARSIAWLALGEVLVFFGVLLVGFAYLWRRGDLAWVRSTTAAERVERVEAEQAALAPEAARTLQHAGAAGHPAP